MSVDQYCLQPSQIKSIRENLALGRTEFANLLGLGSQGERTVRGWEQNEHSPTPKKVSAILALESHLKKLSEAAPFKNTNLNPSFTFIDLFAGIGGIRLPFQRMGGQCVFTSEWDKFAQKTYLKNFGEMPSGDITKVKLSDIPKHDILLGGFPCQAFSQAGLKRGFADTRGTLFFEIQKILAEKRPKAFLLENVKQLKGHDKGRTLSTILSILRGEEDHKVPEDLQVSDEVKKSISKKLNYWVDVRVLRAADFGSPQNRERIFIVGFDKGYFGELDFKNGFKWPDSPNTPTKVGDILENLSKLKEADDKFTISDRLWKGHQRRKLQHKKKGNGFGYSLFTPSDNYTNTLSARYYKDGSEILIDQTKLGKNPRKLTPRECARLQGFPEKFVIDAVSQVQIYKQFGNSVCVNVVSAVAESMVEFLTQYGGYRNVA